MATFLVTDPQSGVKLKLTGDSPPTEQELNQIFAQQQPSPDQGGLASAVLEPIATVASSIVAEPVAGIAGIAQTLNPFAEPGAGAEAVEATREALTFKPRTEAGKAGLEAVGEAIAPVGEAFGAAEQTLGDIGFEIAGPVGGAIGKTIPTALLELTGAAAAKGVTKLKTGRQLSKAIEQATPTTEALKDASRTVFKEIDQLGATVDTDSLSKLTKNIERVAKSSGARRRTTPAAFGVIDEFKDVVESGRTINLDELDELRTVAQNAAKTIDPAQKAPAVAIIDEIDTFLDNAGPDVIKLPDGSPNIGAEYRSARQLWGRARKGELVEDAVIRAKDTASGFENGLRIEFRKILKNKKQQKFLNADEKAAMKQVSEGTKASNLAKLFGRLGISEGQAINIINPLGGAAAGAALFGSPGAIAVPAIGQVSKQLAQKLTKNNSRLAKQVVQAGTNAELIANAYIRNTPRAQRSAIELSELLIKNEVNLDVVKSALAKEAADVAKQVRAAGVGAVAGGELRPEQ